MIIDLKPYPAMKDSGVEWLGKVPAHWIELPLKRIARIDNSGNYGGEPENGKCVLPVATTAQIDRDGHFAVDDMPRRGFSHNDADRYRCRPSDILVVKSSGSIFNVISGKAGIVDAKMPEFVFSNFLLRVVAHGRVVNPRYLFLLLSGHLTRERVKRMVTGSTYPNLRVDEYTSALLPIPPLTEQTAIVRFLDHADQRIRRYIRAKQKLIALLEEQKQAIIHQAVTGQIDVRTGQPYPAYKDSGQMWLSDVPAHWEVRRTKVLFRLRTEKSGVSHGRELLSIYTHIGVRPRKDLEEKGNKASTTDDYWIVKRGDLIVNKLLAWMGAIGVSHYDGVTSPAYDILMPIVDLVSDYYHHLFRTQTYLQQFKQHSRGIMDMRLRLYFEQFGQIAVLVPPVDEQRAIVNFYGGVMVDTDHVVNQTRRQIELLREYRTRLIADVVTGKLDVRKAVACLPDETETSQAMDRPDAPPALDKDLIASLDSVTQSDKP